MSIVTWIVGLACVPGGSGPEDSGTSSEALPWVAADQVGPYPVGTLEGAITSREGVPLTVQTWYPATAAAGTHHRYDGLVESPTAGDGLTPDCAARRPVVLFSHGNEGLRWQSWFLTERLASHGFVVVAPDHTYNTWTDIDYDRMAEVALRRPWDLADSFDDLLHRAATPGDPFEGCVDPGAGYAVVGHSFGGYTAYAAGGAWIDVGASLEVCAEQGGWLCAEVETYAEEYGEDAILDRSDPRAWALVPMSPAGYEVLVGGLPSISAPVLSLTGDEDTLTTPAMVRDLYRPVVAPKHLGLLGGGSHYTFSNACEIVPTEVFCAGSIDLPLAHDRIAAAVVARLRQILGDEAVTFPPEAAEWTWE